jgi:hypothetical protein
MLVEGILGVGFLMNTYAGGGMLMGKAAPHCNENPIYVFPEKELRSLSPISIFM